MAGPVVVQEINPHKVIDVSGTDIDVDTYDYVLSFSQAKLSSGFSIITKTLTNTDIKVFASNKDGAEVDVTEDFFGAGVTVLESDKMYLDDLNTAVKNIIIRVTPTNATNAVNFTIFSPTR